MSFRLSFNSIQIIQCLPFPLIKLSEDLGKIRTSRPNSNTFYTAQCIAFDGTITQLASIKLTDKPAV